MKGEVYEVFGSYSSDNSVTALDEIVSTTHGIPGGVIRGVKRVFDDFKNDVKRKQSENSHNHSRSSTGFHESVIRGLQVAIQRMVKAAFTMFWVTECGVNLVQRLGWK